MTFTAIARAIYDYEPQEEGEIALAENEIVYIYEKDQEGNEGWSRGKNKIQQTEGLFPSTYVEEVYILVFILIYINNNIIK